jgi:hypothetical protein
MDLLSSIGRRGTKLGLLATLCIVFEAESGACTIGGDTPMSFIIAAALILCAAAFSFASIIGEWSLLLVPPIEVPEVLAPLLEEEAAAW